MKRGFKKSEELIRVEKPVFGELYHVAWAYSRGVVGRCMSVDNATKTVILRKPKAKENFKNPVMWSDLRHTRKNQIKIKNSTNKPHLIS